MSRPFFRSMRYERIDIPHRTAHGDPWESDQVYPEVFWWQNFWKSVTSFLCVPGIGSYFPHLYLAFAAEYFFRSFILVVLGVFVWSIFVELPVYFFLNAFSLLPNNRGLWKQFVVYHKRKPSPEEIHKALSFKSKYENSDKGEYYAVFVGRSYGVSLWGGFRAREDMLEDAKHHMVKEVYGIHYYKIDFAGYILWAIILDILIGFLGALLSYHLRVSFGIESFRETIDWALAGEFIGLFVLIAHLAVYWGWIFTPVAFGYIFALGGINGPGDGGWTPYLVFFGATFYFWLVYFRNPIPMWVQSPWKSPERNSDAPSMFTEKYSTQRTQPFEEKHYYSREGELAREKVDDDYLMKEMEEIDEEEEELMYRKRSERSRSVLQRSRAPEEVRETVAAISTVEEYPWSWWVFSSLNYDTYGYNTWFGSMFMFLVVSIIAIAL